MLACLDRYCEYMWRVRTYDLEGVGDDADGHELLAIVAAIHHQRVCEALDNGALCLAEPLDSISAGRVRDVDWLSDLNVVAVDVSLVKNAPVSTSSYVRM